MVFFTCNACGESLKKNAVEKHYMTKCRNCNVLSCVDCGKDFWGDEYASHVKCISEDEKYGGKNYQPKANANKGEVKQEKWTQQIQQAIDGASGNAKLKGILLRLRDHSNIPRKQAKFENFLRNSMRILDAQLVRQAWEILSAQNTSSNNGQRTSEDNIKETTGVQDEEVTAVSQEKDLNKRARKEERRKKSKKIEKKEKQKLVNEQECTEANFSTENGLKTKKKKKKMKEVDNVHEGAETNGIVKKSKKRKLSENDDSTSGPFKVVKLNATLDLEDQEKPSKFNWEETMVSILMGASDHEMSLKKLRKKVLAEFKSRGNSKSEDKLMAKFDKKVNKNPRFKVLKDRVKLKD